MSRVLPPAQPAFCRVGTAFDSPLTAGGVTAEQEPKKMQRSDGSQAQMGGHEHIAALLEGVVLARGAASGKEL